MDNSDGVTVSALSEFVGDTIAAPPRNDQRDRIASRLHRSPYRARQSVFARNPGDGPETAAGYAVTFPAYRMDRASARVYAVVSGMQAPRAKDYEDEGRTSASLRQSVEKYCDEIKVDKLHRPCDSPHPIRIFCQGSHHRSATPHSVARQYCRQEYLSPSSVSCCLPPKKTFKKSPLDNRAFVRLSFAL